MSDERLKIAVFIDFDNIEIGVKNTLGLSFDIGAVLEAIKERGEIITKVAYSDWKRGDYGRAMANHAVRLVQRVMTPGGDKNGADINLALDALEMAFTHDHINAFVIVGGDSDFITLVEKLKQYDKKVFVVGGRQFTSQVMQKNCTEFIAYENVAGTRVARVGRRPLAAGAGRRRPGHEHRHRGAAGAARAEGAGRPRGHAATRPAQEHAAAARLVVLGARLRRQHVPRLRREAGGEGHRAAQAHRPQHAGRAERSRGRDGRPGGAGRRRGSAVNGAARRRGASPRRRRRRARRARSIRPPPKPSPRAWSWCATCWPIRRSRRAGRCTCARSSSSSAPAIPISTTASTARSST